MLAGARSLIFIGFLLVIAAISGTLARPETRYLLEDDKLFLLGTFDAETRESILWYLKTEPQITTLVFTANGGSLDDSAVLSLGREIRQKGLHTHLVKNGVLASGGLSLFLSGVHRTHEGEALIGVHAWQNCHSEGDEQVCRDATEFPPDDPAHDLHGDYTEDMLGSRDLYWLAVESAPADSIHWLTEDEINQSGIFTTRQSTRIKNPFLSAFEKEKEKICGACDVIE